MTLVASVAFNRVEHDGEKNLHLILMDYNWQRSKFKI